MWVWMCVSVCLSVCVSVCLSVSFLLLHHSGLFDVMKQYENLCACSCFLVYCHAQDVLHPVMQGTDNTLSEGRHVGMLL